MLPNKTPRPTGTESAQPVEEETTRTRAVNWIMIIFLAVIGLSVGQMLVWAMDNRPVLEVKNSPFPTRTIREHATANGVIFLDADYCKHQDIDGRMRVSFLSPAREILLPLYEESLDVGCDRIEFPVVVPREIVPEEYVIKFRVTYNKNPLKQNEVVEFESLPVTIDPEITR